MTSVTIFWVLVTIGIGGIITHNLFAAATGVILAAGYIAYLAFREHRLKLDLARLLSLPAELGSESLEELIDAVRYRMHTREEPAAPSIKSLGRSIEVKLATLGGSACALISNSAEHGITIQAVGSVDVLSKRRLQHFVTPFLESGADIGFGLRDETAQSGILSSWQPCGFAYTLTLPVTSLEDREVPRAVLWIGYRDSPPSTVQTEAAYEFVKVYASEFESGRRIAELNAAAQTAQHENSEKSQFIAQMSHDLRSPLSNVRSILTLLKVEPRESEREELIEIALANCATLGEITESVLDLTRHSAGKLFAKPEPFDVRELLQEILASFAIAAKLKGLDLNFESQEQGTIAYCDRAQLKRVLANVMSNAIKYTRSGSVALILRKFNHQIAVEIRDTGCGMTKEELDKLFTPFSRFQGDSVEGVGLGMAVSKLLIELNGGRIVATSTPRAGSKFTLYIPQASLAQVPNCQTSDSSNSISGQCVLLVDDDVDFVATIGKLLEQRGVRILRAHSSSDALSILNFELPTCIITDATMPGGGARELLKGMIERGWQLPCLVLSGSKDADLESELRSLGCSKFLTKPSSTEEIVHWLCSVPQNREHSQSVA